MVLGTAKSLAALAVLGGGLIDVACDRRRADKVTARRRLENSLQFSTPSEFIFQPLHQNNRGARPRQSGASRAIGAISPNFSYISLMRKLQKTGQVAPLAPLPPVELTKRI
jgi:hypothetical protein